MKLHGNAALSWSGRRRLAERVVGEGWTLAAAAAAAGVSVRCARKWVGRYRLEGERGLCDRPRRHGESPTARPPSASAPSSPSDGCA
jgi:transposase